LTTRSATTRFSFEITREIGGPVEDRLEPEIDHVLAPERRHAADPHELFVEPGDDGRGRAGGRHQPEIDLRDVAAIAELAQRRHIGDERRAALAVDRQRRHRARAQMRDDIGEPQECDRGRAGEDAVDRIAAAAIGHLHHVGAARLPELVHEQGQRNGRSDVAQRPRLRLRQRRKLVERLDLHRRVDCEHLRDEEQVGDRSEILLGVETRLLEQELVVAQRLDRQDADGVAVRRRFGAGAPADIEAAARPVLHHDRLAELLLKLLAGDPHEHVAQAPGHQRGDRPHRAAGKLLRRDRRG